MNTLAVAISALVVTLVIHLAEEVKTGSGISPIGSLCRKPVFAGINVVVYTYCFATLALAVQGSDLAVPLAWGLAVAMVFNGVGHISIMVWRRSYFPGGVTAFPLLTISGYLMSQLMQT